MLNRFKNEKRKDHIQGEIPYEVTEENYGGELPPVFFNKALHR